MARKPRTLKADTFIWRLPARIVEEAAAEVGADIVSDE